MAISKLPLVRVRVPRLEGRKLEAKATVEVVAARVPVLFQEP